MVDELTWNLAQVALRCGIYMADCGTEHILQVDIGIADNAASIGCKLQGFHGIRKCRVGMLNGK